MHGEGRGSSLNGDNLLHCIKKLSASTFYYFDLRIFFLYLFTLHDNVVVFCSQGNLSKK